MQRLRITDRGLQITQGAEGLDILTIQRSNHPLIGDSLNFWLKGSLLNSVDIMHGPEYQKYSKFTVEGKDNVTDFARMLPLVKMSPALTEASPAIEVAASDRSFDDYTISPQKIAACISVRRDLLQNSTTAEAAKAVTRIENADLKWAGVGDEEAARVDVDAFKYPFGIPPGFRPIQLAELSNDSLTLTFDAGVAIPVPYDSAVELSDWINSSLPLKQPKSLWA